jgi:hypothetical protein
MAWFVASWLAGLIVSFSNPGVEELQIFLCSDIRLQSPKFIILGKVWNMDF